MVHLPLAPPSFLPDFDALPPAVTAALPRCRALLLNYPNNPTAATADEAFWARALAFAREHDLLLIHDNPYALQVGGQGGGTGAWWPPVGWGDGAVRGCVVKRQVRAWG